MPGPDPILLMLWVSALVASCGFVGMYTTNRPWRTEMGKAMLTLAISLVCVCISQVLLVVLGPEYPFRSLVRTIVAMTLNLGMWWQLCLLIRVQNDRYEVLRIADATLTSENEQRELEGLRFDAAQAQDKRWAD